jgi:hypothetical protein
VEKASPILSSQIDVAKRQLGSLVISDTAYQALLAVPPEKRSLADEVRVVMHEGLLALKQDNETLRLAAQVCPSKPLPPSKPCEITYLVCRQIPRRTGATLLENGRHCMHRCKRPALKNDLLITTRSVDYLQATYRQAALERLMKVIKSWHTIL